MTLATCFRVALPLLLCAVACARAGEPEPASPRDCDSPGFATTLLAATQPDIVPARAHWLDRRLIRWPGVAGEGRFRLHHARHATLVVIPGKPVEGADAVIELSRFSQALPPVLAKRFGFVAPGSTLAVAATDLDRIPSLLGGQLLLVREDSRGNVLDVTALQVAGALDDLYAAAEDLVLGVEAKAASTTFTLWAPTAQSVALCLHDARDDTAVTLRHAHRDAETGTWSLRIDRDLSGGYYTWLVDVFVPGSGILRNRMTDPYSISLDTDSRHSWIGNLDAPTSKPDGWDDAPLPPGLAAQTDMVIYELHVRDFSISDRSVSAADRGKYLAFTHAASDGMRHLRAMSDAGLTDVHLLPVFDIATIPETDCVSPDVPDAAPDSERQQAVVMASAARDCFNWGYDPFHFNAPEGSYSSDADNGETRVLEFRSMVMALHGAGLRVGMDVVYNHMSASGQHSHSVLDRIVPGYYHRLDSEGRVERSTCCDNTATEHRMMAKLMIDSAVMWIRHYRIDSFRFDLMGHQPREAMERLQSAVDAAAGRRINLIGEGWNFGEVADGARFVQASQQSLAGSGIGTFSDRARDALRGGGPSDRGQTLLREQGWLNGLVYAPNAHADPARRHGDLLHAADLARVGLAGSLADYVMTASDGQDKPLREIDYKGQPAGYASQPEEVVNYVENHDNQTLFDVHAFKLPRDTSAHDRARVQVLGMANTAFSQGVAYFHAGIEALRSKSLDRNSYDSGDWFNRLDWTWQHNHFGTGLPPAGDNGEDWPLMRPLLADRGIVPTADDIAFTRDAMRDLLRIRDSSSLFRLRTSGEIRQRLSFPNTGPEQDPTVLVGHLDGAGYPHARFREVLYFINTNPAPRMLRLASERGKRYALHPLHRSDDAADRLPRQQARHDPRTGTFQLPARTALVYVLE